jgi:hypothetical protein
MITKKLIENANLLGLTVEVSDRVRIEGKRAGDVLKAFTMSGCDTRRDGNAWIVTFGGEYVAQVLTDPSIPNYAYGYTLAH